MTRYGLIACPRKARRPLKRNGGNLSEVSFPGNYEACGQPFYSDALLGPGDPCVQSKKGVRSRPARNDKVGGRRVRTQVKEQTGRAATSANKTSGKTPCMAKLPYFQLPYIRATHISF